MRGRLSAGSLASSLTILALSPAMAAAQAVQPEGAGDLQRYSGSLYAGAFYSDNEDHLTGVSAVSPEYGVQLNFQREERRLLANIGGDISRRNYRSGGGGNVDGALAALLTYELIPQRLVWHLNDNLGQSLVNPQSINAPDNRQNFNYFSTGPSLQVPIGIRTAFVASAQWGDVRYRENSALNNQRRSGTAGLSYAVSSHATFAVEGAAQSIRYQRSASIFDYDDRSAYLKFEGTGLKTTLQAEAGATRLEQQQEVRNEPHYSLQVSRKLTKQSTFSLEGGEGVGDNAVSFAREQSFSGYAAGQQPTVAAAGAFRNTYGSAILNLATQRTSINLSMQWQKQTYFGASSSQSLQRTGPSLQFSRQISVQTSLQLHGASWRNHFVNGGADNDETYYGVGLTVQFTPRIGMNALLDHFSGSGLSPTGTGRIGYAENQASLRLLYRIGR